MGAKHGTLNQRFWRQVKKTDTCWLWTGVTNEFGYGMIREGSSDQSAFLRAHRYSWEIANGAIPKGLMVCHRCDNPPCVNPQHLFLGTAKDNLDDARRKGRLVRPASKLTESQVKDIRALYWESTEPLYSMKALGEKYGVCPQNIEHIVNFKSWRGI